MRKRKTFFCMVLAFTLVMTVFCGCTMLSEEKVKLRDLEFTVLSEEKVPEELQKILEEKKSQPFQLTYKDNGNLYICIGYGEQSTGGYSVVVNELYLTDGSINVNTSLLGPDAENKEHPVPSCPMIVIKTELLEQPVIFG